jgi:hypothetical protein
MSSCSRTGLAKDDGSSGDDENRNFRPSSPTFQTFSAGSVLFYQKAAAMQWSAEDMEDVVHIFKKWSLADLKAMVELQSNPIVSPAILYGYSDHACNKKAVQDQKPVVDGKLQFDAKN